MKQSMFGWLFISFILDLASKQQIFYLYLWSFNNQQNEALNGQMVQSWLFILIHGSMLAAGHSVDIVLTEWEKKHQNVTRISLMIGNLVFEAV